VLVQDGNMARRKSLSDEEQLEIMFSDDSEDELIPELDFSDSDSLTLSLGKRVNCQKKCSFIYFSVHFSILSVFFENLTPNQMSRFFSSCKH
jgi:hypothetical protein